MIAATQDTYGKEAAEHGLTAAACRRSRIHYVLEIVSHVTCLYVGAGTCRWLHDEEWQNHCPGYRRVCK